MSLTEDYIEEPENYEFEEAIIISGHESNEWFAFEAELNALIDKYGFKREK